MKLQLMDYSLLLGVHDCEQAEQENKEILERSERKYLRILDLYFLRSHIACYITHHTHQNYYDFIFVMSVKIFY